MIYAVKISRVLLLLSGFLLSVPMAFSALNPVDSLRRVLKTPGPDSAKINALNKLAWEMYKTGEYARVMDYTARSIAISKMVNYEAGLAEAYNIQGVVYSNWGNFQKALDRYLLSLKINEKKHNERNISRNLMNIGIVHMYQESYPRALDYFSRSLESNEKRNDQNGIASTLSNMALVTMYQGDFGKAMALYQRALKINEQLGDENGIANNLLNMGLIHKAMGDTASKSGNKKNAGKSYSEAMDFYFRAKQLQEKNGDIGSTAYSLGSIAEIYTIQKKYALALEHIGKAMKIAREIEAAEMIGSNHNAYAKVYKLMGNYEQALLHKEKSVRINDSIFTSENAKTLIQKEIEFEYSKKEAAIQASSKAEREKITAIALAEKKKQQLVLTTTGIGLLLVLLFSLFMYKRYKVTQEQKEIIELQKHEVEEKNREIQDSIIYARRLQKAILPPQEYIDAHLPENFVFYKPKDIVAGDFYWLETVAAADHPNEKGKNGLLTFVAVADSTGHGVPGAMVSVVCSNALNRAVLEFGQREPGKILDKATEIVIETFMKSGEDIKDGMDISLLAIDHFKKEISWSGANNALWYLEPGSERMKELKADKQPVGKSDKRKPFTTHHIPFRKNTVFYLMTDGYPDQFGGERGKKFKYKQLQALLSGLRDTDLQEQKILLEQHFDNWKNGLEQVDDVCILGLRV